jgi:hypothetical protein
MWEPRRLTTLWASTACCRDRFSMYIKRSLIICWFVYTSGHRCTCKFRTNLVSLQRTSLGSFSDLKITVRAIGAQKRTYQTDFIALRNSATSSGLPSCYRFCFLASCHTDFVVVRCYAAKQWSTGQQTIFLSCINNEYCRISHYYMKCCVQDVYEYRNK